MSVNKHYVFFQVYHIIPHKLSYFLHFFEKVFRDLHDFNKILRFYLLSAKSICSLSNRLNTIMVKSGAILVSATSEIFSKLKQKRQGTCPAFNQFPFLFSLLPLPDSSSQSGFLSFRHFPILPIQWKSINSCSCDKPGGNRISCVRNRQASDHILTGVILSETVNAVSGSEFDDAVIFCLQISR